jgi:exodeoxyribonuclease VII large subunit
MMRIDAAMRNLVHRTRQRLDRLVFGVHQRVSAEGFGRIRERVDGLANRARWGALSILVKRERRVAAAEMRLQRVEPRQHLRIARQCVDHQLDRLRIAAQTRLQGARRDLAAMIEAVESRDPRRVLRRGFSITRDLKTGRIIRSAADTKPGRKIETETADGRFTSTTDAD